MERAFCVLGCGPSLFEMDPDLIRGFGVAVACNRAIEFFPASYWIWMERPWYELSRSHPHALLATKYGPRTFAPAYVGAVNLYEPSRRFPCVDHELYMSGGTLTVATHLVLRLGAKRVVFLGCDAWTADRDRYHSWDPVALDGRGKKLHRDHLEQTREGIRILAQGHPQVEFVDATVGNQFLGLRRVSMKKKSGERKSTSSEPSREVVSILPHEVVPGGYGSLVNVVPVGDEGCVLWFQDSGGTLRAVRLEYDLSRGIGFKQRGQAVIARS